MAAAGLSDGFVFAPKPAAAPAANIRVSLPPHNKDEFTRGNDTIMFNVPSGKRGQYLNTRQSYLKFDVEMDYKYDITTPTLPIVALDGGAHSFFNSLEVYHGTNMLEQIREYNTVYSLLTDMGESSSNMSQSRSVSEGRGISGTGELLTPFCCPASDLEGSSMYRSGDHGSTFTANSESAPKRPSLLARNELPYEGTVTSKSLLFESTSMDQYDTNAAYFSKNYTTARVDDTGARSLRGQILTGSHKITKTYCIPLLSGIMGAQMGQYLPVGSLAADLRLELGLANFDQAVCLKGLITSPLTRETNGKDLLDATDKIILGPRAQAEADSGVDLKTTHGLSLKNIELQLEFVEVAADVQMAIEQTTGGQYVMSYDSFSNFQNAIPRSATAFSQLIGAKFSSIKTAISIFRDAYWMNNFRYKGVTSRCNPFSRKFPNNLDRVKALTDGVEGYGALDNRFQSGDGWQYMIGSTYYPSKRVQSSPESWMECVKASHAVVSAFQPASVNQYNWDVSARVVDEAADSSKPNTVAEENGKFYIAQNLESQSHKSHLAESGVNTLAQSLFLNARFPGKKTISSGNHYATFGKGETNKLIADPSFTLAFSGTVTAATTANTAPSATQVTWGTLSNNALATVNNQMQVDHFIHYDGILIIANGIANTRF